MAVTQEDLQSFQRFAAGKLENGAADSLVQLASQWEAERGGMNESLSETDAHTLSLLAAAFPEAEDVGVMRHALARRDGITTAQLLKNAALAAEKTGQE